MSVAILTGDEAAEIFAELGGHMALAVTVTLVEATKREPRYLSTGVVEVSTGDDSKLVDVRIDPEDGAYVEWPGSACPVLEEMILEAFRDNFDDVARECAS